MKYKTINATKCLVPDCPSVAHIRGLCVTHYQAARRLVGENRVTWQQLEESGKVAPPQRAPKSTDWFMK